jgi:hypothetical protein
MNRKTKGGDLHSRILRLLFFMSLSVSKKHISVRTEFVLG